MIRIFFHLVFADLINMSQILGFAEHSAKIIAIMCFILFSLIFCGSVSIAGITKLWGIKGASENCIKIAISSFLGFPLLYFLSVLIFILWPWVIIGLILGSIIWFFIYIS